jgi:hypothetical protein
MPVQKRGNGWRARRKKGGTTFCGPIRATEAAANEDAQLLDTAAEVSAERLREVHARLTGALPQLAHSISVQKRGNGWRARRRMGKKTFHAMRGTEAAGDANALELDEAAAVSMERFEEVHGRLQHGAGSVLPRPSVVPHSAGWRVRVTIGKDRVSGPTRQSQTEAEKDCARLTEYETMSPADMQSAVARLHAEAAEVGAARAREARFKEVVLADFAQLPSTAAAWEARSTCEKCGL